MALEGVGRVARHHLEEAPLRASGRHRDPHRARRADRSATPPSSVGLRRHRGHEHPRRDVAVLHVELLQERRDQAGSIEVLDAVDDPAAAAEHPARAERRRPGTPPRGRPRPGRSRRGPAAATEHHLLGFERAARGEQLVAQLGRLLELLALGRRPASRPRARGAPASRCPPGTPPSRRRGRGRTPRVVPGDLGHAGPRAPPDVVVEARPLRAGSLVEERVRARPHGEHARQRVEGVADRPRVPVRAEVPHPLALRAAQHLRARPAPPPP